MAERDAAFGGQQEDAGARLNRLPTTRLQALSAPV